MALVENTQVAGVEGVVELSPAPASETLWVLAPECTSAAWGTWKFFSTPVWRPSLCAAIPAHARANAGKTDHQRIQELVHGLCCAIAELAATGVEPAIFWRDIVQVPILKRSPRLHGMKDSLS